MIRNISTRDKKLLLILLGLVVFALGYLLVFRPQMDKASELQTANIPLKQKLAELEDIEANQSYYVSETEKYNAKVADYQAMFPAEVREEDGILLARRMENKLGMWAHSLGFQTNQFVASLETSGSGEQNSTDEGTLSEQANETTQEQINNIEGTADTQTDTAAVTDVNPDDVALYRSQNTIEFNGSYQNLKDVVDLLAAESGRTTIESVDISFSTSTGDLGGTMVVNMYSMTGTGRTYTKPDASVVRFGNRNLFGTISGSTKAKSGDAADDTASDSDASDTTEDTDEAARTGTDSGRTATGTEDPATDNTTAGTTR